MFLPHDLTQPIRIDEPVDFVYHLASPASPIDYLRLPLQTLKVGSYGTHNALGLAKFKRARFLLASTSEVYGDPQVHPQPETYWGHVNPIGPRGVYDEAKRYAEALTMAYHRQQGVDTAIVRIFNTYGPRMRPHDGRAIPTFVRQAMERKPITVFGDGSQTRSFCYVDDLIRGLIALAESGEHLPVNIGNPQEFTLLELAEKVLEVWGGGSEIVFEALPVDDPEDPPARHHAGAADPRVGAGGGARRGAAPAARGAAGSAGCVGASRSRRLALAAAALLAVPSASASRYIQHGIFDDAQIHYGDPGQGLSELKTLKTQLIRVNLVWGGAERRRQAQAGRTRRTRTTPPTTGRSTTGPSTTRQQYGIKVVFSIIGTPPWANGAAGVNVVAARARSTSSASRRPRRRRYSGTFRRRTGAILPPVRQLARLERAEQPRLPAAAVPKGQRQAA